MTTKREILQAIIDEAEGPWIIMKPSRYEPADTDLLCVFENPAQQSRAKTEIPLAWFENAEMEKIKEAVESSLSRAEPIYPDEPAA